MDKSAYSGETPAREKVLWLLASSAGIILLAAAFWQRPEAESEFSQPLESSLHLEGPIRVEILNGCGIPQVAARLTRKARSLGLDVIHEGNAESFNFLHTMVIGRSGSSEKADQVASVLGIGNRIQQITDDAYRLADVTVVIGRDFRQLNLLARVN